MRAALYIRVSTDEQTEYSPAAQKGALLSYAQKNGYIVSENHVYVDEGISGRKAQARPAFMRMIKDARTQKPFDVILVHKQDRFARSREDSVVYKSLLKKECGIKVVSITEQIDDDKFSVILEAMLEAMAEYYSLNLSEEVLKGMLEKAKRGGYQARAPLGYTMQNKELAVNGPQKDIIQYIFRSFDSGISMADIADYLNNIGVKTITGMPFKKRSVQYILNNATYAGYISFRSKANDEIMVHGLHEKIIDEKLFFSVKEKLGKEKKAVRRSAKQHKHFLSGILYCSTCDNSLVYNAAKTPFFQCKKYKAGLCSSHYVTAASIEKSVLDALKAVFCFAPDPAPTQSPALSLYYSSIKSIQTSLIRAKDSYLSGVDSLDQYRKTKEELDGKIEALNMRLKNCTQKKQKHISQILKQGNEEALKIIASAVIEKISYDKASKTAVITLSTIP